MSDSSVYPTDLTDAQWELLKELLPEPKSGPGKPGRPAVNIRQAVNGQQFPVTCYLMYNQRFAKINFLQFRRAAKGCGINHRQNSNGHAACHQ